MSRTITLSTEVFAAIFTNAVHRVDPEDVPWVKLDKAGQAKVMHGVVHVIEFLEMFGIGVVQEGNVIRLVELPRKP